MALMNGLRLYTKPASPDRAAGDNVFYSRRGNGPIYRWLYEAKLAHWRVLRMHTSDFTSRELSLASWKSVPQQLQVQLSEHYLE
jgi:hypothetical protein